MIIIVKEIFYIKLILLIRLRYNNYVCKKGGFKMRKIGISFLVLFLALGMNIASPFQKMKFMLLKIADLKFIQSA